MSESHKFKAEINQLMSLIINAFYSQKEIFLRELVSNASDALDKVRYQSLTDVSVLKDEPEFEIRVRGDKDKKVLVVEDTGVGMTKDELVENLGTVAKSGTKAFMEAFQSGDKPDLNMIGQFGVGFYSSFLVADTVEVLSRSYSSDEVYRWTSDASDTFTLDKVEDSDIKRGTRITLHLKDDQLEYATDTRLKDVLSKHSSYLTFPIKLWTKKTKEEEETTVDKEEVEDGDVKVEDADESDEEKEDKKKTKTVTYYEYDLVNTQKPIWTRPSKEVTEEEYTTFFKNLTSSSTDPVGHSHFKVEGGLEFSGIIYVPKQAPFDMFKNNKKETDIKLYVRRVFITDKCVELVPDYLSFLKGVVDSNDLPLNVSRELLQENTVVKAMRKQIVKKTLELLTNLSEENEEKYLEFYKEYSKNVKLGVHEDQKNKDTLIKLLRFYTTSHKDNPVSLKTYVENMKEGQKEIYYITGETMKSVENAPFLEKLKKKGYEVLLLVEPIDEYAVQQLDKYDEKPLVCVTKEGLKLDDEEEVKDETDHKKLFDFVKETLGENVEKVIKSSTLVDSPCALVTGQYGWTANMQRVMKAQAVNSNPMMQFMMGRKTLELNCSHKLVKLVEKNLAANENLTMCKNLVMSLYQTSLLPSGFTIEDPQEYAGRIYKMLEVGFLGDEEDEEVDDLPDLEEETVDNTPSLEEDEAAMETLD